MNKTIEVYAEIDTLFDARRAIIQKWMTRHLHQDEANLSDAQFEAYITDRRMQGDDLWEMHIAKNYRERKFDHFNFPSFGLTRAVFEQLFKERSVADWRYGFYPTSFTQDMMKVIIDQEQLTDKPIEISGVVLNINTHPYVCDEALTAELVGCVQDWFGGRVEVKASSVDTKTVTPRFYRPFDYVFKYDFFLGDYKVFAEALENEPIPNVCFLVPDIQREATDELIGSPYEILFAQSFALLSHLRTMPVRHSLYDYA